MRRGFYYPNLVQVVRFVFPVAAIDDNLFSEIPQCIVSVQHTSKLDKLYVFHCELIAENRAD